MEAGRVLGSLSWQQRTRRQCIAKEVGQLLRGPPPPPSSPPPLHFHPQSPIRPPPEERELRCTDRREQSNLWAMSERERKRVEDWRGPATERYGWRPVGKDCKSKLLLLLTGYIRKLHSTQLGQGFLIDPLLISPFPQISLLVFCFPSPFGKPPYRKTLFLNTSDSLFEFKSYGAWTRINTYIDVYDIFIYVM